MSQFYFLSCMICHFMSTFSVAIPIICIAKLATEAGKEHFSRLFMPDIPESRIASGVSRLMADYQSELLLCPLCPLISCRSSTTALMAYLNIELD